MFLKNTKRSLLALLSIFMLFICVLPVEVYAAPDENAFDSGYWARYASNYYRSKLSDKGAALYDRMYEQCMEYLCSQEDIPFITINNITGYMMPFMECEDLGQEDIREITRVFIDANPQFYFLKGSKLVERTRQGKQYVTTDIYEEYIDGVQRQAATIQIKEKLDEWIKSLGGYATRYHTVKAIYNLVAENVSYDTRAYEASEYVSIHQSAASAILEGVSVCAGYAELFEMLCCARGIDCIVVTGDVHEWNQVLIDGYWYNMDITWDDLGDRAGDQYFALSDKDFVSLNAAHTPERFYSKYRPECQYNFGTISNDKQDDTPNIKKKSNSKKQTSYH